jgi:hypothetical protein
MVLFYHYHIATLWGGLRSRAAFQYLCFNHSRKIKQKETLWKVAMINLRALSQQDLLSPSYGKEKRREKMSQPANTKMTQRLTKSQCLVSPLSSVLAAPSCALCEAVTCEFWPFPFYYSYVTLSQTFPLVLCLSLIWCLKTRPVVLFIGCWSSHAPLHGHEINRPPVLLASLFGSFLTISDLSLSQQ